MTVSLDRPSTRNSQTPATWRALAAVGESLPSGTRVVVVRSTGPDFSSGIDRSALTPAGVDGESPLATIAASTDAQAAELIAGFQAGFAWLHDRDDVVSLAVVQGSAIGAGFQLALACDLRVCAPDARFAMRETSLGLVPDLTGTHPLVRLVGYSRALDLCLTGRWLHAPEAHDWGLATVVDPQPDSAAARLIEALLASPHEAARSTKAVLRGALTNDPVAQRRLERETQVSLLRGLIAGG